MLDSPWPNLVPIKVVYQFVDGLGPFGAFRVEEGALILHCYNGVGHTIAKSLDSYVWGVGGIVHRFSHCDAITFREGEIVCEYTGP
jgi:hypothetical protein